MLTLPDAIVPILAPFAMLFTHPTWRKAQILLVGAILAPGVKGGGKTYHCGGEKVYHRGNA